MTRKNLIPKNTKVILTGHSKGLGEAIAKALLAENVSVLGISRTLNPALQSGTSRLSRQIQLDLANTEHISQWLQQEDLTDFLSDCDHAVLINNAGMLDPIGPAGTLEPSLIACAITVNVTAPLLLSNAFIKASATCNDRRILHISSGAARHAYPGWSTYCATKAALNQHAQAIASEASNRLKIASVAPGVIDTDMQHQIRCCSKTQFPQIERFLTLKQNKLLNTPQEVASKLLAYLFSDSYGETVIEDLRKLQS